MLTLKTTEEGNNILKVSEIGAYDFSLCVQYIEDYGFFYDFSTGESKIVLTEDKGDADDLRSFVKSLANEDTEEYNTLVNEVLPEVEKFINEVEPN
jgi:hypothetical protein